MVCGACLVVVLAEVEKGVIVVVERERKWRRRTQVLLLLLLLLPSPILVSVVRIEKVAPGKLIFFVY